MMSAGLSVSAHLLTVGAHAALAARRAGFGSGAGSGADLGWGALLGGFFAGASLPLPPPLASARGGRAGSGVAGAGADAVSGVRAGSGLAGGSSLPFRPRSRLLRPASSDLASPALGAEASGSGGPVWPDSCPQGALSSQGPGAAPSGVSSSTEHSFTLAELLSIRPRRVLARRFLDFPSEGSEVCAEDCRGDGMSMGGGRLIVSSFGLGSALGRCMRIGLRSAGLGAGLGAGFGG
mmetsp:Transcript_41566/g.109474  ORF Transcript_41566/g.109474 Transcript_41566/m.109474 type:complete len:236 (-) Transcript_41566:2562-3269(-)